MSGSPETCNVVCTGVSIDACIDGDGCCPPGCDGVDGDCVDLCGNGDIDADETCDPPATCPTDCPDDGDPCTTHLLNGAPETCDATCLLGFVGVCIDGDGCCPIHCVGFDSDCTV
jgi:hypothetical protein